MLRAERDDPTQRPLTIQRIFDRLGADHGMTDVSYSTVQPALRRTTPRRATTTLSNGAKGSKAADRTTFTTSIFGSVPVGQGKTGLKVTNDRAELA